MEHKRDKDSILLGKADGAYMGCTMEDVLQLLKRKTEYLRNKRSANKDIIASCASDLLPLVVAEFENPYDELYNLLLLAFNNTSAGWSLLFDVALLNKELAEAMLLLKREQMAKDVFTDFILSHGLAEQFKAYCEGKTEGYTVNLLSVV